MSQHIAVFPAANVSQQLLRRALLALLIGIMVYVAGRNQEPALTPFWLQTHPLLVQLRSFTPDFLIGQLPSFIHTYVILLLSAALVGTGKLSRFALIGGTSLCLFLECMQHPFLTTALSSTLGMMGTPHSGTPFRSLLMYAESGTFDGFDLVAILLASIVATLHIATLSRRPVGLTRSS